MLHPVDLSLEEVNDPPDVRYLLKPPQGLQGHLGLLGRQHLLAQPQELGLHLLLLLLHGHILFTFFHVSCSDKKAKDTDVVETPVAHAWLGAWPAWLQNVWPAWLPTSPAWLILAGPLSFRATCYYYRKFYYRAYFMSPPGCAVGPAPQKRYMGETFFFLFQNLHRYTWYIAVTYIVILGWDAFVGFWQHGEVLSGQFGIGVGTVMLCLNAVFLGLYVLGCHSCRHIVAGKLNCFSCTKITRTRYSLWQRVTRLNEHHMFWGWVSMIWVGLTDAYIRLCANGIITDYNTW